MICPVCAFIRTWPAWFALLWVTLFHNLHVMGSKFFFGALALLTATAVVGQDSSSPNQEGSGLPKPTDNPNFIRPTAYRFGGQSEGKQHGQEKVEEGEEDASNQAAISFHKPS